MATEPAPLGAARGELNLTTTSQRRFWSGVPPPTDLYPGERPVELSLDRWEEAKTDFCARIVESKSVLKIVLHQKDDHYFLEPWIEHHAHIVGLDNLVILDHMSSNDRVRRTYAKYQSRIPIIQFDGHYNDPHHTQRFPELYECLEQASEFWAFFDTDEFLVLIEGKTHSYGAEILDLLRAREHVDVFPTSWLTNVLGSDREFLLGRSVYELVRGLGWGKPIVRSRLKPRGVFSHAVMLDRSSFSREAPTNLFLLHMMQLFPQQRLDTNMRKLRAMGVASSEDTPESVLQKDLSALAEKRRKHAQLWIDEIRVHAGDSRQEADVSIPRHTIELADRGEVTFHGPSTAEALDAFLTAPQPFMQSFLDNRFWKLQGTTPQRLKADWQERSGRLAVSEERAGHSSLDKRGAEESRRARILALYLPQFYPIPENNRWWGHGFTEWTNVVKARPLFPGHYQPHLPANLGFYDLRVPEVREAQAQLARRHGIEGFCYWHYWFHGKRLLERPFNEVLASGRPDFPFCLSWANETWSRRWHGTGAANEVLQEQRYSLEDDRRHVRWLIEAFADPRYIKVNGRPLFLVYRPTDLPDPNRTTDLFRSECGQHGLPEPFLVGCNSHADHDYRRLGFDCTLEFEPQLGLLAGPTDPGLKRYDYTAARAIMASRRRDFPSIPCIFVQWDNTPRRAGNGIVFTGSTPEQFESGLADVVRGVSHKPADERVVIINAWNEWAEGNHLEPDLQHGLRYLEAVRRVNRGEV